MMRSLTVLALLGCTVLGACGTENRGLESVHQPVVARTDYVYDLPAPGDRLSEDAARGLGGWFESLNLRYGDRVSVDTQGYDTASRNAIGAVAARYGLLVDETAPVTQGTIPAGSIRVIVSRMSASVPNCPDWSRPANANFDGHAMSNYGCATNSNLAAMIADPRDLISGRSGPASVDAATASKAIQTYRKAPSTGAGGLKSEATKGN
jgi:pilus assembly protein CpaD